MDQSLQRATAGAEAPPRGRGSQTGRLEMTAMVERKERGARLMNP